MIGKRVSVEPINTSLCSGILAGRAFSLEFLSVADLSAAGLCSSSSGSILSGRSLAEFFSLRSRTHSSR